ncbi:MAG: PqqD family peptide modification chaperone [Anaerolineae bacterium]
MKDATDKPPPADSTAALPVRNSRMIHQRAGKDTLLYDPDTDRIHLLNPTALAIWEQCDGRHTPAEIAAYLAAAFARTSDRDLLADVHAALASFAEGGLLAGG